MVAPTAPLDPWSLAGGPARRHGAPRATVANGRPDAAAGASRAEEAARAERQPAMRYVIVLDSERAIVSAEAAAEPVSRPVDSSWAARRDWPDDEGEEQSREVHGERDGALAPSP